LPFDDVTFDAVICQFGVMFFPDRPAAYAEARRVLAPGGTLMFNVWDRIEANDFAAVVTRALAALYPADPPQFMARTPHGYHDQATITSDLHRGGYARAPIFETVAARSRAPSAAQAALAYCQGTPLRNEIEARAPGGLEHATAVCTRALVAAFGSGPVDGAIRAHVVTVEI
jgi:SAM-dependent methyltransferase